jgi:hypothetical protein
VALDDYLSLFPDQIDNIRKNILDVVKIAGEITVGFH